MRFHKVSAFESFLKKRRFIGVDLFSEVESRKRITKFAPNFHFAAVRFDV